MPNNSSDVSINTGDIFEIDFPARLREDGKDKDRVKYCIPLINNDYNNIDFWNFNTTSVLLTTSKDYPKDITIGVEIPENTYNFIPEGTYIICSQVYTLPKHVLKKGEKLGSLSTEHTNEIRIATSHGIDVNIPKEETKNQNETNSNFNME